MIALCVCTSVWVWERQVYTWDDYNTPERERVEKYYGCFHTRAFIWIQLHFTLNFSDFGWCESLFLNTSMHKGTVHWVCLKMDMWGHVDLIHTHLCSWICEKVALPQCNHLENFKINVNIQGTNLRNCILKTSTDSKGLRTCTVTSQRRTIALFILCRLLGWYKSQVLVQV